MTARGWGGTGGRAGTDGKGKRWQAAVDSLDLAVNGHPGSVSITGCTGRMWALPGSHLEPRVGETEAGEGRTVVARGVATSMRNRAHEKVGKIGEKGRRCSLLQRGALRTIARWQKAVELRCIRRPRCSGDELVRLGFVG
jgi:hypothetical protein